jgi:hypothetical protein
MHEPGGETPRPFPYALKRSPSLSPWVLFGVFAVSNLLLSCFSLPIHIKGWVAVLGLFVPFLLSCREIFNHRPVTAPGKPELPPFLGEFLPSGWMRWGPLLFGLALFLRFWELTSLSV